MPPATAGLGHCPPMDIAGWYGYMPGPWKVCRRSIWRVPARACQLSRQGRSAEATASYPGSSARGHSNLIPLPAPTPSHSRITHLAMDGAERAVTRTAGTYPPCPLYVRDPRPGPPLAHGRHLPFIDLAWTRRVPVFAFMQVRRHLAATGRSSRETRIWPTYGPQARASGPGTAPFGAKKPVTQSCVTGPDLGFYRGRCWVRTNVG